MQQKRDLFTSVVWLSAAVALTSTACNVSGANIAYRGDTTAEVHDAGGDSHRLDVDIDPEPDSTTDVEVATDIGTDGCTEPVVWYLDNDFDGFGDPDVSVTSCDRPGGYVRTGGDCADDNLDVNPGADEVCDGLDNDCDGSTDGDAIDARSWYPDADGDHYGDAMATAVWSCVNPDGDRFVNDGTDCVDEDSAINPGATESCTDEIDLNCDGSVGYADADGDDVPACLDCNDLNPTIYPGNVDLCDGLNNDCDLDTADGSGESTLGDACDGPDADRCEEGHVVCVGGGLICDDDTSTTPEICDGADNDCDSGTPDGADDMAVGVPCSDSGGCNSGITECVDGEVICNDPGSNTPEVCDGLDNDCDGEIDEGLPVDSWYVDFDGDGHGAGAALVSCRDPGDGYSLLSDDCNETSDISYTGAPEICDGLDNNCEGTIDADSPIMLPCTLQAGVCSGSEGTCGACGSAEYSANAAPATWEPDETLCDEIDNDCDGEVDEGCGCPFNGFPVTAGSTHLSIIEMMAGVYAFSWHEGDTVWFNMISAGTPTGADGRTGTYASITPGQFGSVAIAYELGNDIRLVTVMPDLTSGAVMIPAGADEVFSRPVVRLVGGAPHVGYGVRTTVGNETDSAVRVTSIVGTTPTLVRELALPDHLVDGVSFVASAPTNVAWYGTKVSNGDGVVGWSVASGAGLTLATRFNGNQRTMIDAVDSGLAVLWKSLEASGNEILTVAIVDRDDASVVAVDTISEGQAEDGVLMTDGNTIRIVWREGGGALANQIMFAELDDTLSPGWTPIQMTSAAVNVPSDGLAATQLAAGGVAVAYIEVDGSDTSVQLIFLDGDGNVSCDSP